MKELYEIRLWNLCNNIIDCKWYEIVKRRNYIKLARMVREAMWECEEALTKNK